MRLYSVPGKSGMHVEDGVRIRGRSGHMAGCDIDGVGLGHSPGPAIPRVSPHFPPAPKVGAGALLEEGVHAHASGGVGKNDVVRALAAVLLRTDAAGLMYEVLRQNRTDRSRRGKERSSFRLVPRQGQSPRGYHLPILEILGRQSLSSLLRQRKARNDPNCAPW